MAKIIFVHGTGVREADFSSTFAVVESALAKALDRPDDKIIPCYWGTEFGSNLGAGRSVPGYAEAMAIGDGQTLGDEVAQWALLLNDPLLELRILAARDIGGDSGDLGQHPDDALLRSLLGAFRDAVRAASPGFLKAADAPRIELAVDKVLDFDGLDAAVSAAVLLAPAGKDRLNNARLIAARAIAAGWMQQLLMQGVPAPMSIERDAFVAWCVSGLGESEEQLLGLGDAVLALVKAPLLALGRAATTPVLRAATFAGRTFKRDWASAITPGVGDVLLYQAAGAALRERILHMATTAGEPVVLLAHSLGGIACIDLLASERCDCIKGIITAGSQSPYLYEIGALSQLPHRKAVPDFMPPWLNFYDQNDFLSFIAEPLMQNQGRVRDVEVHSGQPFPASHSAYWTNPAVWSDAAAFIKQVCA